MPTPKKTNAKNFALIGVAGYVAPRHLKAIQDVDGTLVAASDPHDSVGILDTYFPQAAFFTEIERFDRHLEKLRRRSEEARVHYVSICTPNYLHDAHMRLALRLNAHAICEKPLVIMPKNLEPLISLEQETGCRIFSVLQLRVHPVVRALKKKLELEPLKSKAEIILTYVTHRGAWYKYSWKGSNEQSGGIAMNIGIHFFDLLIWLFGDVEGSILHLKDPRRMAGSIELEHARVRWFLSVDEDDLPKSCQEQEQSAYRSLNIDGEEFDFSGGFADLHSIVYQEILEGKGFSISDARTGVEFVHSLRDAEVIPSDCNVHPFLKDQ